jgi:hypothetical protein
VLPPPLNPMPFGFRRRKDGVAMTPRRSFLKSSLLLSAAATFFPGSAVASDQKDQPGEGTSPIKNIKKEAIQYFLRKGYRDIGELPLITNETSTAVCATMTICGA